MIFRMLFLLHFMTFRIPSMSARNEEKHAVPRIGAIVVAAGQSSRMRGVDKIFYPLGGMPIVWHRPIDLAEPSFNQSDVLVDREGKRPTGG